MEATNNFTQQNLAAKNILITGGTTGIGRATALQLSKLGANIFIIGQDKNHLEDAMHDIKEVAMAKSFGILADLSSEQEIESLFDSVKEKFEKIDVLINNAALPFGNPEDGSYKDWEKVIATNLLGVIACSSQALKLMKEGGHIVNIGSMSADVREETGSVYVATKSGLQGFTEAFRKNVNQQGIKVTLIEPGAVDTDMQEKSREEKLEMVRKGEMLASDDIAVAVIYCLSQPKRCDVVELKVRPHLQLI